MLKSVFEQYGLTSVLEVVTLKGGLINSTWKIVCSDRSYILQKVNNYVFNNPEHIANNIKNIGDYLKFEHPWYLFVPLIPTIKGEEQLHIPENGHYRLFPFVEGSVTYSVLENSHLAYEAAVQFGRLTKLLAQFPTQTLHIPLPDFHNLRLRYNQFESALITGNKLRLKVAENSIDGIKKNQQIVKQYDELIKHQSFKTRVMHHDTKINNVLFDTNMKGLCVIDLDTLMPGYFISDVGDMMRTYLSPVSEEETDFTKIEIREDFFQAIVAGYLSEMKQELSKEEIDNFIYAGKFIIYMQAIRFLTDYLLNDVYYGEQYLGHNLVRANNQFVLLQKLIEKEPMLEKRIKTFMDETMDTLSI